MASNQAAWLDGQGKTLRVADGELPKAGPDDIVVRNHAVAINPVDWKIADYGLFLKTWPNIVGEDVAGEVYEVGSNVTRFKKGDRVFAHVGCLLSNNPAHGGFQRYTLTPAVKATHIPSNLSYAQASVIPLGFDTALVGLSKDLGLPLPSLENKTNPAKTIVVYGASSSVGANVIQIAANIGIKTVAVASKHNFDFVRSLGANETVDYRSGDDVADNIVAAVKRLGGEFAGVYDAISNQDSYKFTLPVLEKLGGGNIAIVLPPPENVPAGIKVQSVFGVNDITDSVWEKFLTPALEKGVIKATPEPLVIGKGLDHLQAAMDANKKGVSAKKVVVEL